MCMFVLVELARCMQYKVQNTILYYYSYGAKQTNVSTRVMLVLNACCLHMPHKHPKHFQGMRDGFF